MALLTFSWKPDLGARRNMKPNVTENAYSDGYTQRFPDGLNSKKRIWEVEFTASLDVHEQQESFLDDHGGYIPFLWEDPRGVTRLYVCKEWDTEQFERGVYRLSGRFEETVE